MKSLSKIIAVWYSSLNFSDSDDDDNNEDEKRMKQ